jgi:triosephosphate isomerase
VKHLYFAANWKMHLAPADAKAWVQQFTAHYARQQDRSVIVFPGALTLHAVREGLKERPDIQLGVQHIHWEDKGAFTGENAAPIARAAGARFALVGHSERRHLFGETDEETGRKVAAAVRAGLMPILCVGETLAQRDAGETTAVVVRQVRAGIAGLQAGDVADLIVAYEPVWAIGSGRTATPADANAVHQAIKAELRANGGDRATAVPVLYGGSVNRANAEELVAQEEVDGVLVGGASLDPEAWGAIVRAGNRQ